MLYMFLVLPPLAGRAAAAAMSAMTTSASASRLSALSLVMALFMFGYVVRVADRLRPPLRLALCKIAMGLTMGYMLVVTM
jgi:hypothetical protein